MNKPKTDEEEAPKCGGQLSCENPGTKPHICPFAQELHGDETLCTCCEDCEQQCAMDI